MKSVLIKTIPGYEFYSDGRIWNEKEQRFLDGYTNKKGYNKVIVNGKLKGRHRWIAMAFLPNPDNLPQVDHINEDKSDCRIENLRWASPKTNCNNGTRNERIRKKLYKPVAQFSLDFPCELIKVYPSIIEAARQMGVSASNISECCNGKRKMSCGFGWAFWED